MHYNSTLKAALEAAITSPANPKISGDILQQQLLAMVNAMEAGAVFMGAATPATSPTGEANCFYLAATEGTYNNFLDIYGHAITIGEGEAALLSSIYDNNALRWKKNTFPGRTYLHIMYSVDQPAQDSDIHATLTNGDKWIGICADLNNTAPTKYDSYQWAKFVGDQGTPGHNPNCGTYTDIADAPATGQDGDYIVIVSGDPATGIIYKWDATANDNAGGWESTGAEANEAEFATGQSVIEVPIDETNLTNPATGALPLAEDIRQNSFLIPSATINGNSWKLQYSVENGKTYYVKLVGGIGDDKNLGLGSTGNIIEDGGKLKLNTWKKIQPDSDGMPFVYIGSTIATTDPPQIVFSAQNPLYSEVEKIYDKINNIFVDTNSPNYTATYDDLKIFSRVIKGIEIYGATQGYTYFIANVRRNYSTTNRYLIYFGCFNQSGDYINAFYNVGATKEIVEANGTLVRVSITREMFTKNNGVLNTDSLPSKVVICLDYSQMDDDSQMVSTISLRFPIYSEYVHLNDDVYDYLAQQNYQTLPEINSLPKYPLKDDYNMFVGGNATPTSDGKGIVIPAGNSSNDNNLGIITANFSDIFNKIKGEQIHLTFVFTLEGEDYENITLPQAVHKYPAEIGTVTNVVSRIVNNYLIVDFDLEFGQDLLSGQVYLTFKTTSTSNPVTVRFKECLYRINDNVIANFGEAAYLEGLTYGIHEIAKYEANKIVNPQGESVTTINVSRDVPVGQTTPTGRVVDFSGLYAISDAINSITDASETNRYVIHVEGVFKFTDPLTVPMFSGKEYSVILMKEYVDIEGNGGDDSVVIIDFPANANFHSGKTYSDYQPIYFYGVGGTVKNIKFVGRNCRYTLHGEKENVYSENKVINIENCEIYYLGHPDYSGGYEGAIGCGMASGCTYNYKNCIISNPNESAYHSHCPLSAFKIPPQINFENCIFDGNIGFGNYQVENNSYANFINCRIKNANGVNKFVYQFYNNTASAKHGLYVRWLTNANSLKTLYSVSKTLFNTSGVVNKGAVIRVVSSSTGTTSVVRFDKTSSAFPIIITDMSDSSPSKTIYSWDMLDGYVYRDGGVGLNGQAFGTLDIDETSTAAHSLASLLGDCSSSNKQLVITIDSVDYTVTFNEDYTSKDNAYVIGKINDVIGSVATAEVFCPALLFYPNINYLTVVTCVDSRSIMKGMGIVITKSGDKCGVRRAKNSDGHIDGIALDDMAEGQTGRIIKAGYIYTQAYRTETYGKEFFTTLDDYNLQMYGESGGNCGISNTDDGVFKYEQAPAVLRKEFIKSNDSNKWCCWKIM